jgi:hypothetical protein
MKSGLNNGNLPKYPGLLTVPEVADRLGITANRVNQLVHKNRFVAGEDIFRIGSAAIVIKEEAVQRFLRERAMAKGLVELVPDVNPLDEIEQIANGFNKEKDD